MVFQVPPKRYTGSRVINHNPIVRNISIFILGPLDLRKVANSFATYISPLVGGFHPFEKHESKWVHLPQFSGRHIRKKYLKPPPMTIFCASLFIFFCSPALSQRPFLLDADSASRREALSDRIPGSWKSSGWILAAQWGDTNRVHESKLSTTWDPWTQMGLLVLIEVWVLLWRVDRLKK